MTCLACGREIPADRVKPAGIHGYPDALCAPCIERVWTGSMDALTVVNALLYRIEQLEAYENWSANELRALAPREPSEIPLF